MEHSDARCRVSQWVERRPTTRRGAPRPALTPERRIATLAEEPATLRGDDVTSVKLDVREAKQFIGGEWTGASGGGTFEDLDPFTGDVVALVPAGSREDAVHAVAAAAR